MPQLDKITYISQTLWILLLSFNSYILLIFVLFLNFINIRKVQIDHFMAVAILFSSISLINTLVDYYKKNIIIW